MKKSKWIIGLFLICLYIPTLTSILKADDVFSKKEKRYLAQKPELTADTLLSGKFGNDYETYLNDQFPFREPIAALHTDCERLLGKSEISGVYFGLSDYFIEHHQKTDYTTELAKRNENDVFEFLEIMSKQLGENRVRFLPIPSAETVLTGYLPKGAPPSVEHEILADYDKKEFLVPVKEALENAHQKENVQLYYRTDHHWTMHGAFAGYQAWAASTGITPRQLNEFEVSSLKEDFYGSVSARINTNVTPDSLLKLTPKFPVTYEVEYFGEEHSYDSLYAEEMLKSPEPYAVYLKGNQAFTRIKTDSIAKEMSNRKLLVIKDSFGNSLVPFLVNHYPETLVVDLRYYNLSLAELIKKEEITDLCVVFNLAQMAKEKTLYKINR